ncbi:MAG: peroxiredoxin [Fibrobacteres bacterium]|nr:peroxiredoxin [Fibrobacterota bacterium]
MSLLQKGTPAPSFKLHATPDQELSLEDFRGKNLVLVFYPADWSPVCGDELAVFNEVLPMIRRHNAELVAISVDGTWCHQAFKESRRFGFPLLSDFEPKGEVSRNYGIYREGDGESGRALYVIDGDGIIQWSYLSPVGINPGAEGILKALESIPVKEEV